MDRDEPVVARMQALVTRWETVKDRRAVFLGCYALMTRKWDRWMNG
jgi:hypothetical protein